MTSWNGVVAETPELAAAVRARFDAHGLGLLATLRADGSPRISGIEPSFGGELWLGMMGGSLKAADLLRDPRLELHSATTDKDVARGDAKVSGRGVVVRDAAVKAAYVADLKARTGYDPGEFELFRVEVARISLLRPGGDHLDIDVWAEGRGTRRIERH